VKTTKPQDGRRRYNSPRRREQAEATRAQIAAAARRLFAARGWAGTTVRDVAREAGVAEPTVYATYGSKAGLARALIEAVESQAEFSRSMAEVRAAQGDPAKQLAVLVHFDRRLFERGADVIGLMRDADRAEPELHAAYQDGRNHADQLRRAIFGAWPAAVLRDGVDAGLAADYFAALCNIDVYRVLTQERGWSVDQVERWWRASLTLLLLR
jgi:TetR/AcrR family transcriptional regulator, regulator of cefoperazone and chloramphenicol sensitivity